jgi:hypothetical protein
METISFSETSVHTRATRRNIPEDSNLHLVMCPKFEPNSSFEQFGIPSVLNDIPRCYKRSDWLLLCLVAVIYQKRLKKERKARRRLQDQLELEMKRRSQLEEALKASGASADALRMLNGKSADHSHRECLQPTDTSTRF